MLKYRKNKKNKADQRSQEGAAMLAVMLILLLATAGAAITVESTGFEARSTGYNRMATQAKNISEASLTSTIALLDKVGAQSLWLAMLTNYEGTGGKLEQLNSGFPADEPPLLEGQRGYRVKLEDYVGQNVPIDDDILGPNQSYSANFTVDIYDTYITQRTLPGYHAEGNQGTLNFLQATYIARGQLQMGGNNQIEHLSCACVEAGPFKP